MARPVAIVHLSQSIGMAQAALSVMSAFEDAIEDTGKQLYTSVGEDEATGMIVYTFYDEAPDEDSYSQIDVDFLNHLASIDRDRGTE